MAEVENLKPLLVKLDRLRKESEISDKASVVVGFTAAYAVYVHENLEAKHPVGQAKFLEEPARTLGEVLRNIVLQALKKGKKLIVGLLLAGLRLQREAQQRCPVDTGALKGSGFTRVEGGDANVQSVDSLSS